MFGGYCKVKRAAHSRFAFYPDSTAMHLDQSFRYRKTQTNPAALLFARPGDLIKLVKDLLRFMVGNPRSRVRDRYLDPRTPVSVRRHEYFAACGTKFDGVADKIQNDLTQTPWIAPSNSDRLLFESASSMAGTQQHWRSGSGAATLLRCRRPPPACSNRLAISTQWSVYGPNKIGLAQKAGSNKL